MTAERLVPGFTYADGDGPMHAVARRRLSEVAPTLPPLYRTQLSQAVDWAEEVFAARDALAQQDRQLAIDSPPVTQEEAIGWSVIAKIVTRMLQRHSPEWAESLKRDT